MASPALGAGTPPFLTKTYAMVDDPETDDTISWNESGTAFVVWRRAEFERDLLPKNFKHSNFASFVRQLNTYVRSVSAHPPLSGWFGAKPMLFGVAIGSKRSREDGHGGGDEGNGAEEDGEDDEEEQEHDEDDERHAARREQGKAMRTERSDLNVLSLSVRAAAAARPDGGSRDRSGNH
ncbi:Heat stress transcription factor B-2a [Triticum urartu]|uniref:Heat stress transcription factor B-2a n=1 Tax=Triticum urartu TaxID=4572 RepID=M7YIA6_TRIUA|nr:Heat stress transcription factor B-2a [Triticum urartu]